MIALFLNCFEVNTDILIIAMIYLDRLVVRCTEEDFHLTNSNIKLALFSALVLSIKFYDDRFEKNTIFSAVACI